MTTKIRFCFSDSATGEDQTVELECSEVSGEAITRAFATWFRQEAEVFDWLKAPTEQFACSAFVMQGTTGALIISVTQAVYFREYLVTGLVYTEFA